MKCAYCKYNDGAVYTSMPPKYRCTITNESHLALDDCNVEFAPVKHGRWIIMSMYEYRCSLCGAIHIRTRTNYCPNCGAQMMGEVKE